MLLVLYRDNNKIIIGNGDNVHLSGHPDVWGSGIGIRYNNNW